MVSNDIPPLYSSHVFLVVNSNSKIRQLNTPQNKSLSLLLYTRVLIEAIINVVLFK